MKEPFAQLREEYREGPLRDQDLLDDPIEQFHVWFRLAAQNEPAEANAMTLACATPEGRPSARIVLLKELDERGFVFFSNYESRKGRELAANPQASLVFYWSREHRQVRVEGHVERIDPRESDEYFAIRPRGAQLGAWTSDQSRPIDSRRSLEERRTVQEERFAQGPVDRPPHWGGYRVVPEIIEFWQGRPDRLHDRLVYRRAEQGWTRERLMP